MPSTPDAFAAALAHIDRVFAAPATTRTPARQADRRERAPSHKDPRPDNKALIQAAVRTWIAAAQTHPRGAELLRDRVSDIESYMHNLGNPDAPMLPHLEGLTAFDLACAHNDLFTASMKVPA
jgi:hypothetical protein